MTGLEPVRLVGGNAILLPLTLEHVPGMVAAASESRDTYQFTLVPRHESETVAYVRAAVGEYQARKALPFVVMEAKSGRVVGTTRFGNIEFWDWPAGNPHQRGLDAPDVVEIGWTWLASSAQRTAINTEAKLMMLTHAFEEWRVHRVSLRTDARNARSRAAIERLGAKLDGTIRAAQIAYDGGIRDTAVYSIRDSEWPDVKAGLTGRLRLRG